MSGWPESASNSRTNSLNRSTRISESLPGQLEGVVRRDGPAGHTADHDVGLGAGGELDAEPGVSVGKGGGLDAVAATVAAAAGEAAPAPPDFVDHGGNLLPRLATRSPSRRRRSPSPIWPAVVPAR